MLDINVKGTLTSSDSLVLIVAMLDINFPLSTKNEGYRSVLIVAMLDIN